MKKKSRLAGLPIRPAQPTRPSTAPKPAPKPAPAKPPAKAPAPSPRRAMLAKIFMKGKKT